MPGPAAAAGIHVGGDGTPPTAETGNGGPIPRPLRDGHTAYP